MWTVEYQGRKRGAALSSSLDCADSRNNNTPNWPQSCSPARSPDPLFTRLLRGGAGCFPNSDSFKGQMQNLQCQCLFFHESNLLLVPAWVPAIVQAKLNKVNSHRLIISWIWNLERMTAARVREGESERRNEGRGTYECVSLRRRRRHRERIQGIRQRQRW